MIIKCPLCLEQLDTDKLEAQCSCSSLGMVGTVIVNYDFLDVIDINSIKYDNILIDFNLKKQTTSFFIEHKNKKQIFKYKTTTFSPINKSLDEIKCYINKIISLYHYK